VLAFILAFHGDRLALAQETELTPEQLYRDSREWQKVLDKYPNDGESGPCVGDICRKIHGIDLSGFTQELYADILVGKTPEEL